MGMEGIAQGDRSSLLLSFVFALILWSTNLLLMPNISLGINPRECGNGTEPALKC